MTGATATNAAGKAAARAVQRQMQNDLPDSNNRSGIDDTGLGHRLVHRAAWGMAFWRFGVLAFWRFGVLAFWLFGFLAFWLFGVRNGFSYQDRSYPYARARFWTQR